MPTPGDESPEPKRPRRIVIGSDSDPEPARGHRPVDTDTEPDLEETRGHRPPDNAQIPLPKRKKGSLRRAMEDPLARAIAAAQRFVRDDDDSDTFTLRPPSDADAPGSAESSSDEADNPVPDARKDARRRHYLVTWSAPKKEPETPRANPDPQRVNPDWSDGGHERFAGAVCRAYKAAQGSEPERWVVAREKHQDGRPHYHMALQHKEFHRWRGVANHLRNEGIYVDFKETDTYPRGCAYILEPSVKKIAAELDANPVYSPGHPPIAGHRRVTDVVPPASECEEGGREKLKPLDLESFYELVVDTGIRTRDGVLEYATTDRRLARFYMYHGKFLEEHLKHAWNLVDAHTPPAPRPSRIELLEQMALSIDPCVGRWKAAAEQLLTFQGLAFVFEDACLRALERGRGKDANIWLVGETGRGKSFLIKPLLEENVNKLYNVFANPAPGRFALQGLPGADVVVIEDYRCEEQIVPTRTWLTWLDGQRFNIPIPRTEGGAKDMPYTGTAPVIVTSSSEPYIYVGKRPDRSESAQLAARFTVLRFQHYFPNPDREIPPCTVCFARLLLQARARRREPDPCAGCFTRVCPPGRHGKHIKTEEGIGSRCGTPLRLTVHAQE